MPVSRDDAAGHRMVMTMSPTLSARSDSFTGVAAKLLAVLVVLLLAGMLVGPHYFLPAEDAIILHQYSRNLAETGAITFIPHGPHAEGATDFLWMVLLAGGFKLGLPPLPFTELLNVLFLLGLGYLLTKLSESRVTAVRVLLVAGALMLTPQMIAALEGFSVVPFALALTAVVFFLCRGRTTAAMICALLLCLLRPDGVVFAVPLLVTFLPRQEDRGGYLRRGGSLFVLPDVVYFLWRWQYFGHLLPLPFLVKSDVHRRFGNLAPGSLPDALPYLWFSIALLVLACRRAWRDKAQRALLISLLVVPTVFYVAMRLDQNVADRFFFYIPLTVFLLVAINWRNLDIGRRTLVACAVGLYMLLLAPIERGFATEFLRGIPIYRRHARLARELDRPELHGVLMSSEAGLRPYFSRWDAVDPWGLNTAEYASSFIQPQQVAELHPDLVVLHVAQDAAPCSAPPGPASKDRTWGNMVGNVERGLDPAKYDIWLLPYLTHDETMAAVRAKTPVSFECWYVSRRYRGRDAVGALLRGEDGVLLDGSATGPG